MFTVLRYFFILILTLILIYILIVVFRSVFFATVNTASDVVNDANTSTTTVSNVISNSISGFNIQNLFKNFKPFSVAPISVVPNITSNMWNNPEERQGMQWQNLNESPDNHPTDWAPVDSRIAEEKWGSNAMHLDNVRNNYGLEMVMPSRVIKQGGYYNNTYQTQTYFPISNVKCVIAGCNNEMCVDELSARNLVTECTHKRSNACFATAKCALEVYTQKCSWVYDEQLVQCLKITGI